MDGVLSGLVNLLAPERCVGCGMAGDVCCARCMACIDWIPADRCERCGHPPVHRSRCDECLRGIVHCEQACLYDPVTSRVMRALKDEGRSRTAGMIARAIAVRCAPAPSQAVLVPVPLTGRHRRRRGYNQSALIARHLGVLWGISVDETVLGRRGGGVPQRGAGRYARRRQVADAFHTFGRAPAVSWLVDDVITTGATLEACARVLRAAGSRRVGAVAFARTPQRVDVLGYDDRADGVP